MLGHVAQSLGNALPGSSIAVETFIEFKAGVSNADGTGLDKSFGTISLGSPDINRVIAVFAHTYQGSATAVSIGGVAATKEVVATDGATHDTSLWTASVPSGSSGEIIVTRNNTTTNATGIEVYRLITENGPTPIEIKTHISATADTVDSVTMTSPAGVGAAAISGIDTGGNLPTFTWSGAVENYDAIFSSFGRASSAVLNDSFGTVTATKSSSRRSSMIAAVWA